MKKIKRKDTQIRKIVPALLILLAVSIFILFSLFSNLFVNLSPIVDNTYLGLSIVNVSATRMFVCNDTDAGIFSNETGKLSAFIYSKNKGIWKQISKWGPVNDSCTGSKVRELYCLPNGRYKYAIINCPLGCNNGKCLTFDDTPDCIDTDNGINYGTYGEISGGLLCQRGRGCSIFKGKMQDTCISQTALRETFCTNGKIINSTRVNCANGIKCENGKCNSMPENKYLKIEIKEEKIGENIQLSLNSLEGVYGDLSSLQTSSYYPEEEYPYILETRDASGNTLSQYALQSSRFIIYDNFGSETDPGGIIELNESIIEAIIPLDLSASQILINNTENDTIIDLNINPSTINVQRNCKIENEIVNFTAGETCCNLPGLSVVNYEENKWACTKCGDGICSQYENKYTCQEDCQ